MYTMIGGTDIQRKQPAVHKEKAKEKEDDGLLKAKIETHACFIMECTFACVRVLKCCSVC
jgi:hypothetical protein